MWDVISFEPTNNLALFKATREFEVPMILSKLSQQMEHDGIVRQLLMLFRTWEPNTLNKQWSRFHFPIKWEFSHSDKASTNASFRRGFEAATRWAVMSKSLPDLMNNNHHQMEIQVESLRISMVVNVFKSLTSKYAYLSMLLTDHTQVLQLLLQLLHHLPHPWVQKQTMSITYQTQLHWEITVLYQEAGYVNHKSHQEHW